MWYIAVLFAGEGRTVYGDIHVYCCVKLFDLTEKPGGGEHYIRASMMLGISQDLFRVI